MAKVFVTKPSLPQLDAYVRKLESIWATGILTNLGPFHNQLEKELEKYLKVNNVLLFNNATIALMAGLKALELKGEVITTPFTFAATAHSIVWNNLKPVFVDIDPVTMNIDPARIEEKINSNTSAILAVHVYGNPCEAEKINLIAEKYKLKVIYDAAHAFGVECDCGSILTHGDLSILSFHATKVFNTFEGGVIICNDDELYGKIKRLRNFGIVDEEHIDDIGLNGKMNEVCAAFGLLQLLDIDVNINKRKSIAEAYDDRLSVLNRIKIYKPKNIKKYNYSYYPIILESGAIRDDLYEYLKADEIFARKYFYPLLSNVKAYQGFDIDHQGLLCANDVSSKVLCLPIYPDLTHSEIDRIMSSISKFYDQL